MRIVINRVWAMQRKDSFDCKPLGDIVKRYLVLSNVSIDPFSRNKRWATYTNDINPHTQAEYHLDARLFLDNLISRGVTADLVILDPPYSQVQVSRSYHSAGKDYQPFGDDNNAVLYRQVRNKVDTLLVIEGVVLSFGWNSVGMGRKRGYILEEILLVCHGSAHNDTIVTVERKIQTQLFA